MDQMPAIDKTVDVCHEFPNEPVLFPEDTVTAKHPLDRKKCYIPFRSAGFGRILITRELLLQLYEKEITENQPNAKLEAGILIEVPDFPDRDKCPFEGWEIKYKDYWNKEIGSFVEALKQIGEGTRNVTSPYWYKKVNWKSLKTICTISAIAHDTYIQDVPEVEYEWHSDVHRFSQTNKEECAPVSSSALFTDFNTAKFESSVKTAVWIIDSVINYSHLDENERSKIHPLYYEYSSDSDDFEGTQHEFSQDDPKGNYNHGTSMCKIIGTISSANTSIHFVQCPQLGHKETHVLRALQFIDNQAVRMPIKYHMILITLGGLKFRCTDTMSPLFRKHHQLHRGGFIFICTAGNIKFSTFPQPEVPQYPLCLFENCGFCVVVGGHGINKNKVACLPSKFGSAGCCIRANAVVKFTQGVDVWAIAENIVMPKNKHQAEDQIINGTSVAAAVVTAGTTFILPQLLTSTERLRAKLTNKLIYAEKFKQLLEKYSDTFHCPIHKRTRNLIFNLERYMENLSNN